MNIREMPAGREMDVLVAEKVMGWTALREPGKTHLWIESGHFISGWRPSTDIAAAWQVVEKMKFRGKVQQSLQLRWAYEHDSWKWKFSISGIWAVADTASLAICRAALMAVEAKQGR